MPLEQDLQHIQQVRQFVQQAVQAQKYLAGLSQAALDRLVAAMVQAGYESSTSLARMAVEETGMGRVASKVLKNQFATRDTWQVYSSLRTVGVLGIDRAKGVMEVAQPVGVIAGIVPTTNPTSTVLFKCLIALKGANSIVLAPHPRAVRCTNEAAAIMARAASAAGAPAGVISCLPFADLEATTALMRHPDVALILATGGPGLVKAAYSSGKPAYGVGAGNAPAFIERSAVVEHAVRCLVTSQLFDYGTICSSEQSVIIDAPIQKAVYAEFERQGGYFLTPAQTRLLTKLAFGSGRLNAAIVGQSAVRIAAMAGFHVPEQTTVLLVPLEGTGPEYPLAGEKLAPILACYTVPHWMAACELCCQLLQAGGMGHTLVIHSTNSEVIMEFALRKPASRILVNTPASQGGIGSSTGLAPSLTLGCGTTGGNITSDNITPLHLVQIRRVALVAPDFAFWEDGRADQGGIAVDDLVSMAQSSTKQDAVPLQFTNLAGPEQHEQKVAHPQEHADADVRVPQTPAAAPGRANASTFDEPTLLPEITSADRSKSNSVFSGGVLVSPPQVTNRIIRMRRASDLPTVSAEPSSY